MYFFKLLILFSVIFFHHNTLAGKAKKAYIFYYFEGYAGEKGGLYASYSYDLHKWYSLGKQLVVPSVGEYKVFRDPCVMKRKDTFHLVWTTGISGFGYANSKNGLQWENIKFVTVADSSRGFDFANVWAPELYFEKDTFYIIWASTLKKDYVPPVEKEKWWTSTWNHRLYYVKTTDFKVFSDVKPFWDPGFNVIDAVVYKSKDLYYLFFKDERKTGKNVLYASGNSLLGPYQNIKTLTYRFTEGAIPVKKDTLFYLYYDYHHEYNGYRYITSKDMVNWSDEILPEKLEYTDILRHGSIVEVPLNELEKLKKINNLK